MRKKVLTIIPVVVLLVISAVLLIIAIVVFTEKKNSVNVIKATKITETATNTELEADGLKLYCTSVKKDNKNNFIIKSFGFIRIAPTDFEIIAIKNADKLSVRLENGTDTILLEGKKDGSYYKFNIKEEKDKGYIFIIENQSTVDLNIGYIKYWK